MNLCLSLLDEAQTELARGQTPAGMAALERALGVVLLEGDAGTVVERRATTAVVRLEQGRHAEAVREAEEVFSLLSRRHSQAPGNWKRHSRAIFPETQHCYLIGTHSTTLDC